MSTPTKFLTEYVDLGEYETSYKRNLHREYNRWLRERPECAYSILFDMVERSLIDPNTLGDFLSIGIDLNMNFTYKDNKYSGMNILHVACLKRRRYLISYAIGSGININSRTLDGHTPYDVIIRNAIAEKKFNNCQSIIKLLANAGCEKELYNEDGYYDKKYDDYIPYWMLRFIRKSKKITKLKEKEDEQGETPDVNKAMAYVLEVIKRD